MGIPPLRNLYNTIPIHILPFAAERLGTINRKKVPKTLCFRDFFVGTVGGIRIRKGGFMRCSPYVLRAVLRFCTAHSRLLFRF